MQEIPSRFKGSTKLDSTEGFLKGPFILRDSDPAAVSPTFHVTQKGLEIRWPGKSEEPISPKLFDRLFRAVGAKKEAQAPITTLKMALPRLAQAFREEDQVQLFFDGEAKLLAVACSRQTQLAFAIGHIRALLPLKGAANLLFENMSEAPENKEQLILRTSLKALELKIGRVTPLGYYNVATWKSAEGTPAQEPFVSIVRSGVSLTMDDLKHLSREWSLTRDAE